MTVRPNFTGPAAVPPNLTLALSPSVTSQASPGAQVLTATPTGGTGSIASYAWEATYVSDGSSANALLSGSGATRTLTTTTYSTSVLVTVTATDSGSPAQTAPASASVEVGAPPALVPPSDLTPTTLGSGTTSQVFTFDAATGGGGTITYTLAVESSTGAVTLSTSSGRTATLQGLTDGATVRVTLTATDAYGQPVTADGIWGVAVAAVYAEEAEWVPVEEVIFTALGSGSRSGTGALTVGSTLFTVISPAAATGISLVVDSNGARISQTSGVGTSSACYVSLPLGLSNFAPLENVLIDLVFSCDSVPTNGIWTAGFGDGTYYGANDFFGFQGGSASSLDTGSLFARRYQSSTATNQSLAASQTLSGTYAGQILLVGQRIAMSSLSRASDYLGGPKLGTSSPMRGTWSGSPGGAGLGAGSTITSALTSMKITWGPISAATGVTMKKARISRLTRPPST